MSPPSERREAPALTPTQAPGYDSRVETKRLFIAVPLAASVRERLRELQDAVEAQVHPKTARWIPEENIHITLHFLGETEENRVAAVTEAIDSATARHAPFEFTISGTGCFPSPRKPRVLWAGVRQGEDRLVALAHSVQEALKQRGFPPPDRDFHPHVTLAYVRKQTKPPQARQLPPLMEQASPELLGAGLEERLTTVALYQSTLSKQGAQYAIIHRSELSGASEGHAENG
jgi:2'-5' RNA ligase